MNNAKEAKLSVERFRKALGPFVVAVEKTRKPMLFTDAKSAEHRIIYANASFSALTGYKIPELIGTSLHSLLAPDTTPEEYRQFDASFAGPVEEDLQIRCRRADGGEFWATIFTSPVENESGDVVQHFVSLVDITAQKEAQRNAQMLIDELDHRVKYTLATVHSLVRTAFNKECKLDAIRAAIESRVNALSRSNNLLNWRSVGIADLVHISLEPFGPRNQRIYVEGDNIPITSKIALALGIAFHELALNAVKYGALCRETGSVFISWTISPSIEGSFLTLRWTEKNGPPVSPPSRKGFGSLVIERSMPLELQCSTFLDYRPYGLDCTMSIPVPENAPLAPVKPSHSSTKEKLTLLRQTT